MAADIPLAETFIETDWSRYSVPSPNTTATTLGRQPSTDGVYPWALSTLNHVDVRPFNTIPPLNTTIPSNTPENWIVTGNTGSITMGPTSSLNYWRALTETFISTSGLVTLTSVAQPLDLTVIGTDAIVQAAIPSSLGVLTLSQSFLDFSTDGFNTEIASVPLSDIDSTHLGEDVLWLPLTLFNSIDLSQVNGVRLRLQPTVGGNLAPNGGFEHDTVGVAAAGWDVSTGTGFFVTAGSAMQVSNTFAESGSHSLKITGDGTQSKQGAEADGPATVPTNTTYSVSVWLKGASGGETLTLGLGCSTSFSNTSTLTLTTTWTQYTFTHTFATAGTNLRAYIRNPNATAFTCYADNLMLVQSSTAPTIYVDGDTPGYEWTGTTGDSSSQGFLQMTGIRVIDPNYEPSSIMFDNWNDLLRQDIPFNGSTTAVPVASNQQMPPITYVANTGGTDDPQPIDASFGMVINTGSNTGTNSFSINMRQVGGVDTSQLLLDEQTQLQLSSGQQPGLVQTAEIARHMSDFQGVPLSQLEGQSMLNMDAVAEHVSASWIQFQFTWGTSANALIGVSTETVGTPYQWNNIPTLSAFTNYLVICTLTDNTVQMQVWSLNQTTFAQQTLIFDTTEVTDSYQFPRRPGRIGWQANFTDGGADLVSIRPQRLMFAEYQSSPLNSRTPVQSARLYATYASDLQLWDGFTPTNVGPNSVITPTPTVTTDTARTITGSSTRIFINDPVANQGVISNPLSLDSSSGIIDMTQTVISLSVWFPSNSTMEGPLDAFLVSETGWYVPLTFPQISYDTWQPVTFDGPDIPSGIYQLQVVYTGTQQTTFWIDNVSVSERALTWDARANSNDPWTPFNGLVNSDSSGAMLNRGTALQVRAQARRQDAAISSKPKIVPDYAQLGKAVWPEDIQANPDPYTYVIATTSAPIVSGSVLSGVPVQPLSQTQATAANALGVVGTSFLTIGSGNLQSTFSYIGPGTGGPSYVAIAGTTDLFAFEYVPPINIPAGTPITALGAPIETSVISGRTYSLKAYVQEEFVSVVYGPPYMNYIVSWLWQISDGTVLSGINVTHTFSSLAVSGTPYDITLTTMDCYGGRSTQTVQIEVA